MRRERPPEPSVKTPSSRKDSPSTLVDDLLADDRATLDEVPIDGLFDRIARDTVDREPTLRDRLRELATPTRVGIAVVALIGCGAAMISIFGMRNDLDLIGLLWLIGVHTIVMVGSVFGLALALRPTHKPPLNGLAWAAVGGVLVLPILLSVVPGLLPGMHGTVPTVAHVMCGSGGLIVALPVTVLVLLLDRSEEPSTWRVLLGAGAAGLSAFGFGYWHCPSVDPTHLIAAHGGLGAALGLVSLSVVRISGWLTRR